MYCLINFKKKRIWGFLGNSGFCVHRQKNPSIEYFNGDKKWCCWGNLHRRNHLPAIELVNGQREWWKNGKRYREKDLPSVEYANGTKEWYCQGNFLSRSIMDVSSKLGRLNDLPAVEYPNGDKEWWHNGKRHRDNGPAVIYGNKQYWFKHGEFIKCSS